MKPEAFGMSVVCRFWGFFSQKVVRWGTKLTRPERVELDDYLSDLSPERCKALVETLRRLLAKAPE
jgi:hypothetical protein